MSYRTAIAPRNPGGIPAAMPVMGGMPQSPAGFNPWGTPQPLQRQMTVSNAASPFGCCNFFDQCSDGVFSLNYDGTLQLLDWMGFNVTGECYRSVEFITYARPDYNGGEPTASYLSDPCADPNGIEFGSCKLTVEDFGLLGRTGKTRSILKPTRYCKTTPRFQLNGMQIDDEAEWDMLLTMDVLLDDVRRMLIVGNSATPGQFDGLERWIRTGYTCTPLDSFVINWAGNPMSGGAGLTYNGNAIPGSPGLMDILLDINAQINQRISWSPMLRSQTMRVGQKILVMPTFMVRCLLDHYTCWSICPDGDNPQKFINTLDAREFRKDLMGGLFGHGFIELDGEIIPILAYDWELIKGPKTGDIYFLTGGVGNFRIWEGEHLDSRVALQTSLGVSRASKGFFFSDNGRVLGLEDNENLCELIKLWMSLRLFNKAPWAQARIQSVQCERPLGILSPDPTATSFYPNTDFTSAVCP